MLFRLKQKDAVGNIVGTHFDGVNLYHPGDTIESDRDLRKIFRNKFELVVDAPEATIPSKPNIPVSSSRKRGKQSVRSRASILDVTADYPQAKGLGIKIKYSVERKKFAVKRGKKVLKVAKNIVALENFLDSLAG